MNHGATDSDAAAIATSSRSRRRWYQFSIWSLLVATTLTAVLVSLFVVPARRQRDAVAKILSAGGRVNFDYQTRGGSISNYPPEPPGPRWLRKIVGNDYFQTVDGVMIVPGVDDPGRIEEALRAAASLTTITDAHVESRAVNDSHMALLAQIQSVRQLVLGGGPGLTDQGLVALESLGHLQDLALQADITDAGLVSIARLTNLRDLEIVDHETGDPFAPYSGSRLTDRGLVPLEALGHLERLVLHGAITDDGLASIAHLKNLQTLEIDGQVTDEGMRHLFDLQHFHSIRIHDEGTPLDLDERFDSDFVSTPLADVIDYVAARLNVEWEFDKAALSHTEEQIAGIKIDDAIVATSAREALERILGPHGLGFRVEDCELIITTRDESERAHAGLNALREKLPRLRDVHVGW